MLKSRSKMTKVFLLSIFFLLCTVSFQSCTNNNSNDNLGFFYSGNCPITEAPTLTDSSLCIGIEYCPSQFCSAGSGSGIQVIIGHQNEGIEQLQCNRRLANLSLRSCSFGVSKDAEIKSFSVDRSNGRSLIRLKVAKGAVIEPEEENDTDNKSDRGIRIVSFHSLKCGYRNENSILNSGALHRARLNKDQGSIILSDSENVICGSVDDGGNLECTYNISTGCIFTLTLWGYDPRNNFSEGKTIEIRGN